MQQRKSRKSILLGFTLLTSILIFSCSKNANEVQAPPIQAAQATAAQAASVYNSQSMWEANRTLWVPCANNNLGEYVKLTGYVHFTDHMTVNGNHFTLVSQGNFNQMAGTGLITGDRYAASGGGRFIYEGDFVNGQFTASGADQIRITGAGPGNNALVSFRARITVNANGTVTREMVDISVSCN